MKQEYIDLYLKAAKQYGFTPRDTTTEDAQREIMRYLLAMGLVPLTAENIALGPKEEFHIGFEHLPNDLKDRVKSMAKDTEKEWEYSEDTDEEELEAGIWTVEGVWIKQGKITQAHVLRDRKVRTTTEYLTPEFSIDVE